MNNNELERQKRKCKEDLDECMRIYDDITSRIERLEQIPIIQEYKTLINDSKLLGEKYKTLEDEYIWLLQQTCAHPIWVTTDDVSLQNVDCSCILCGLGKCLKRDEFSNIITVNTPEKYTYIQREYEYLQAEKFSNAESIQLIKRRYTKEK